ncbi:MAG: hypothetical protein KGR98_01635 [Verrucomicrobia bacterium]|nr:hypothetical protein [Verrucomicrobiota bacterium]MDE3099012.1 hypothetical protein [Verrucomicrobiota bacterium]
MGDTKRPALKVRDYRLYELDRIAADALRDAKICVKGRRVDIERLILEKFKLKIESFADLRRRWDAYAFIDTTARVIFMDADLMNEERFERKYRRRLGLDLQ